MIKKIFAVIFTITFSAFFSAILVAIPDFLEIIQKNAISEYDLSYIRRFMIGSMFFASFLSLIIIIILGIFLSIIKKFNKLVDFNYSLILPLGFTIGGLLNFLSILIEKETIIPFTTHYSPAGYGHTWGGGKILESLGISLNNWELTTTLMMGLLGFVTSFILHKSLMLVKNKDYQHDKNNKFFRFINTSFISSFFISTISVFILALLILIMTIMEMNINTKESLFLLILFNYFMIFFPSLIISIFLLTPLFFIFERFNKLNWLSVIFIGIICSLFLSLIKTYISFNVGINILIGIILSGSFYKTFLWSENRKKAQ